MGRMTRMGRMARRRELWKGRRIGFHVAHRDPRVTESLPRIRCPPKPAWNIRNLGGIRSGLPFFSLMVLARTERSRSRGYGMGKKQYSVIIRNLRLRDAGAAPGHVGSDQLRTTRPRTCPFRSLAPIVPPTDAPSGDDMFLDRAEMLARESAISAPWFSIVVALTDQAWMAGSG
jgi:hypothetical protein